MVEPMSMNKNLKGCASLAERQKVIFISGWGRSGSTILNKLLGQIEGIFSCGELLYLWDRGLVQQLKCGCGESMFDCETWGPILRKTVGNKDPLSFGREMTRLQKQACGRKATLRLYFNKPSLNLFNENAEFIKTLAKLHDNISQQSGQRIIVDSSKLPSYGYLLEGIDNLDVYVIHLVRDPRAVAYSWQRKRLLQDNSKNKYLVRHNLFESSLQWRILNKITCRLWGNTDRFMRIKYEDFIAEPASTLQSILEFIDERALKVPAINGNEVELKLTHTAAGNPNRMRHGRTVLKADNAWQNSMNPFKRKAVAALSWPMLKEYGY